MHRPGDWKESVSVRRKQQPCFGFLGMAVATILAGYAQSPAVGWGAWRGLPVWAISHLPSHRDSSNFQWTSSVTWFWVFPLTLYPKIWLFTFHESCLILFFLYKFAPFHFCCLQPRTLINILDKSPHLVGTQDPHLWNWLASLCVFVSGSSIVRGLVKSIKTFFMLKIKEMKIKVLWSRDNKRQNGSFRLLRNSVTLISSFLVLKWWMTWQWASHPI